MKIKKLYHALYCSIVAIVACGINVEMEAANSVGHWSVYGSFSIVENMVDTPHAIYYTSNGQLFMHDKDGEEIYNFSTGGNLSDNKVESLYYNRSSELLAVVYSNANIDIIDSDGTVSNMPDLKDATLDILPVVNDVEFDGDIMYVATNFGIVVFDCDRKEVVTSGIYNKNITSLTKKGDTLWVVEGYIYYCIDLKRSIVPVNSLQRQPWGFTTDDLKKIDGDMMVIVGNNRSNLAVIEATPGNNSLMKRIVEDSNFSNLQQLDDGSLMCYTDNKIYMISHDGEITDVSLTDTPLGLSSANGKKREIIVGKSLRQVWMGDANGISLFTIENGAVEQLSEPAAPVNMLSFMVIGRLEHSSSGAVYASEYGPTIYYEGANDTATDNGWFNLFHINKIKDGNITDISPLEYEVVNKNHRPYGYDPVGFKSGTMVKENPRDPEAYVVASYWDGVYYFKDRRQVVHYDASNSTLRPFSNFRMQVNAIEFDRHGNMWVVQMDVPDDNVVNRQYHMLPADKVGLPTTESDWQVYPIVTTSSHDGKLIACRHSNNIFYIDAYYKGPVNVIKTKGTTSIGDDDLISVTGFTDQDGIQFSYQVLYSILEDKLGRIWVGTDNGIFEITRPDDISSNNIKVNHLKVPRRDGTNYADYLLNGETIYDMAVDHSNRKWIATQNSGVYLVSADGDEILQHFDVNNSPLLSNSVFSVTCGDGNDVYFGTPYGLCEYSSDSSPAGEDYSRVYAYPNPVRPEYTGWITVTGLMDNSLVKIADAAGNVIFQDISQGGMMTWNGCDRQGNRVKTGVYYVFASQRADTDNSSDSNAAVTKILVIN